MLDNRIKFKIGENIYSFEGTLSVTSKIVYDYEKKCKYNPNLKYQFGKRYKDNLRITIISTPTDFEKIYSDIMKSDFFLIGWHTSKGYQTRKINDKIEYPNINRGLTAKIDISISCELYSCYNHNMPDIISNTQWNESTIENTIWR